MFLPEEEFKLKLIFNLNTINPGWEDGDKFSCSGRKVDIVNRDIKVAIEIKDYLRYENNINGTNEHNLTQANKRIGDDERSTYKKFVNFSNFKTILLFRTELEASIFCYSINGPIIISDHGNYRERKYSDYIRKSIGCYLVLSEHSHNSKIVYCKNKFCDKMFYVSKKEVENIWGQEVGECHL